MKSNLDLLNGELHRIKALNSSLSSQNKDLKLDLVGMNNLRIKLGDNLTLFALLFTEIDSLRRRLSQTNALNE
jgi:hypothetical protein